MDAFTFCEPTQGIMESIGASSFLEMAPDIKFSRRRRASRGGRFCNPRNHKMMERKATGRGFRVVGNC